MINSSCKNNINIKNVLKSKNDRTQKHTKKDHLSVYGIEENTPKSEKKKIYDNLQLINKSEEAINLLTDEPHIKKNYSSIGENISSSQILKQKNEKFNIKDILAISYAGITNVSMIILQRIWGEAAPDYSYFFVLSLSIGSAVFFFLAYIFEKFRQYGKYGTFKSAFLDNFKTITKQSLLIGFLLSINYWAIITSNVYIEGPIEIILSQSPIVFSVFFSYLLLQRKYSNDAYLGTFLVFLGSVLSGIFSLKNKFNFKKTQLKYSFLYLVANLPLGILPIFYEAFHKVKGKDGRKITSELRLGVTNFILFGFLILMLPLFWILDQPPFRNTLSNIIAAIYCIFFNTYQEPYNNCFIAKPILFSMVLITAAQMHSQILLSRRRTGTFASIMIYTSPFLGYFIYPFLPNNFKEIPSVITIISAIISFIGVLIFTNADLRDFNSYKDLKKLDHLRWFIKQQD